MSMHYLKNKDGSHLWESCKSTDVRDDDVNAERDEKIEKTGKLSLSDIACNVVTSYPFFIFCLYSSVLISLYKLNGKN
jgi:hypothetical protein